MDAPGTAGKVDPPEHCLVCLIPVVTLVACDEQMVPDVCIVDAAFTGVENVVTNFSTHSHSETAGPPEVDYCYYTGETGLKYCDTTGDNYDINLQAYWKRMWNSGTGAGTLSLHADFAYGTIGASVGAWLAEYTLEVLSDTYSTEDAFTTAADTELRKLLRRTLALVAETGTRPSSLVPPDSLIAIAT